MSNLYLLINALHISAIYYIVLTLPYCYRPLIYTNGSDEFEYVKRKCNFKITILTSIYIICLILRYVIGGDYMVIETIFLLLLLVVVLLRLYSVNSLAYMRENRINDDRKRKNMKLLFIICDALLFILVIVYLFMKGFLVGIF